MASDHAPPARVQAILRSQSYVEADQDLTFLDRAEVRGLRLQLDYAKAELLLEEHGIRSTIVVLGSTRIPDPAEARRQAAALRTALKKDSRNVELARRLAVAERVLALAEGVIDSEDLELFWFAETAQEVWDEIVQWHLRHRTPVIASGGVLPSDLNIFSPTASQPQEGL